MSIKHKAFRAKADTVGSDGTTRLVVATLGVEDSDGDVTLPGFFGRQAVRVLPVHNHLHVPLGKGLLYESGDEAVVDLRWNLDIPEARSWFAAVSFDLEHGPPLQQWSYGFSVKLGGARRGEHRGREVQFLQPLSDGTPGAVVHEVSPVLLGAGVGTRTLASSPSDEAAREYARFVRTGFELAVAS